MMPTSETEIREILRRRASAFSMDPQPPPPVTRRVHKRIRSKLALVAGGISAGFVAALLVGTIGVGTAPQHGIDAGARSSETSLKLVSYLLHDTPTGVSGSGEFGDELRAHIDCMRAQGFTIPDPVRTADGWTISIDPGVVDVASPAWREAAFVTCRFPRPASGNFILGLSKERVDRFVACVSSEGFDLPAPSLNDDGAYVFDLSGTNIDMGQPEWSRVAFVTCSPDVEP